MRISFSLTLLASAMLLSGCTFNHAPEVGLVAAPTQYNDTMLDSLGAQRYTEQQMLYVRKVKELEHQMNELDEKRKAIESSIGLNQLEAGAGKLLASDSEAERVSGYADSTQEAQARIAQEDSEALAKKALIENERDRKLMDAEIQSSRRLVELDQEYGAAIEHATSDAEKARLMSELEVEKAKAEAQRKKAQIDADTARDISSLEQIYQLRITEAKRKAQAVSQAESGQSQAQRIQVAIVNAESKNRLQAEVSEIKSSIAALKTQNLQAAKPYQDELSRLNEQVASINSRLESVDKEYSVKVYEQQGKLETLQTQISKLVEVEHGLINAPVISSAQAQPSSAELQRLENELQVARSEASVRKASKLAQVDEELSQNIGRLSSRMNNLMGSSLKGGDAQAASRVEKALAQNAIQAELAAKKTDINNEARNQLTELAVATTVAKAKVVAPVLTSRAVYSGSYGSNPEAFAARAVEHKTEQVAKASSAPKNSHSIKPNPLSGKPHAGGAAEPAPLMIVSSFEPKPHKSNLISVDDVVIASGVFSGGDVKPLVVAPAATTYSVVYVYAEKGSAEKFMNYLRAYGVSDFTYRYSQKLGQHVLFMGKFTSKGKAAGRVAFLNKTTNTQNAKIIETDI